jgi:hypothetical protein
LSFGYGNRSDGEGKGARKSRKTKKILSLFEQASDPILITDFKEILPMSMAVCKLFWLYQKELLRMNIKSLVCPYELKERPLRNDLLMKGSIFSVAASWFIKPVPL